MEPYEKEATSSEPTAELGPSSAVGEKEEQDSEECGWCRWMKAGGCRAEFQVWLDCVDAVKAAGRDDVESCASVMMPLWECMERNKDYYQVQMNSVSRRKSEGGDVEGEDMEGAGVEGEGEGQRVATSAAGVGEGGGSGATDAAAAAGGQSVAGAAKS